MPSALAISVAPEILNRFGTRGGLGQRHSLLLRRKLRQQVRPVASDNAAYFVVKYPHALETPTPALMAGCVPRLRTGSSKLASESSPLFTELVGCEPRNRGAAMPCFRHSGPGREYLRQRCRHPLPCGHHHEKETDYARPRGKPEPHTVVR